MTVHWYPQRFLTGLDAATAASMTRAAGLVEERAKASMKGGGSPHVPSQPGEPPHIDTGALRRSGQHHVIADGKRIRGFVQFGGGNVPYALALEHGTRTMAPRPYLRPALEDAKPDILRILRGQR